MPRSDDAFLRQRERSKLYEIAAGEFLRERGSYVIPSYDYSGAGDNKAPKALGPRGEISLVLPDLLAFRPPSNDAGAPGAAFSLEIKLKTEGTLHKKTGDMTTGMSLRHYDHYKRWQVISGHHVFVAFVHEDTRQVRVATLDWLAKHEHHRYMGDKMGRAGMVFWDWEKIPRREDMDRIFGDVDQAA